MFFNLAYILLLIDLPIGCSRRDTGKYRRGLWDKLVGRPPDVLDGRPVVWIHAVSVGEVGLIAPLLNRLQVELPGKQFVLSVTTDTGLAVARSKYPGLAIFTAPFDFTWAVGRIFDRLRPELLILTELELWPNWLLAAQRRRVPVVVVNARLSARSFRGYQRLSPLLRPALAAVKWWGRSPAIAERVALDRRLGDQGRGLLHQVRQCRKTGRIRNP